MGDPLTLVFMVLAGIILFRLYKVLGETTGEEKPYNPFEDKNKNKDEESDVININDILEQKKSQKDFEKVNDPILGDVYSKMNDFDKDYFIEGAKSAYEIILEAYAEEDQDTLKSLLSKDLYNDFAEDIQARRDEKLTLQTTIIGIDKADIVRAEIVDNKAQIYVSFDATMISVTKNDNGEVVEGSEKQINNVHDDWVFEKSIRSRDPKWTVIAMEHEESAE